MNSRLVTLIPSGCNLIVRSLTSSRASINRITRAKYLRMYPTTVVNPDGSTFTVRYHEPRQIVKLPFDISALTGLELKARLEKRKPRTRIDEKQQQEVQSFDAKKYLKYMKKK